MSRGPLTVVNAEITTAAVEVKTLTIKGKQVTLAVFRQIPHEDLFGGEDMAYRGNPWGTVNYHHAACPDREHRHVVWQLGSELRKSTVPAPHESLHRPRSDLGDKWLSDLLAYGAREPQVGDAATGVDVAVREDQRGEYCWEIQGREIYATITGRLAARRRLADVKYGAADPPTLDDLRRSFCAHVGNIEACNRSWATHLQRWQEVLSLPQLFIAV